MSGVAAKRWHCRMSTRRRRSGQTWSTNCRRRSSCAGRATADERGQGGGVGAHECGEGVSAEVSNARVVVAIVAHIARLAARHHVVVAAVTRRHAKGLVFGRRVAAALFTVAALLLAAPEEVVRGAVALVIDRVIEFAPVPSGGADPVVGVGVLVEHAVEGCKRGRAVRWQRSGQRTVAAVAGLTRGWQGWGGDTRELLRRTGEGG